MLPQHKRLDAIAWKCEQIGLSYGELMNSYTAAELEFVYDEYERVLKEREDKIRKAWKNKPKSGESRIPKWLLDKEDRNV